ncbi:ATP-binding protein [Pseudonocardia alni]|uniref:ATP-binding protein n=1 Tax=Pseudonocardia alni TaxID=33907 RepID=UPI0033C6D04D
MVESTRPGDAISARLAGADVVLPCTDPYEPDPAELTAACEAALVLARRARISLEETRLAAHDFAGTSSAVAMVAQLMEVDEPGARRAGQLRELAARGAELAWRGGRAARSVTGAVERVDVDAVVRAFCRDGGTGAVAPRIEGAAVAGRHVLVDRTRLVAALSRLVDNARRAGASSITVRLGHRAGRVTVTVEDDGCGLEASTPADLFTPFVSRWPVRSDGLGLSETSEFARDHGGEFSLAARDAGAGCTATLTLPVVDGTDRGRAMTAAPGSDPEWAVARVLEGVARRARLEESLEALVATMEDHLPDSRCSILLFDPATDSLHHGAGARLPTPYRRAIDGVRIGPAVGSCGTAAYVRDEVVARDIAVDERWEHYRDLALPHRLRSCWSTPILDVDRGVVLGTFAVYHASPWAPDQDATGLVQRLTHVAAVAISTSALHAQLVESEARFRSTFETTGLGLALVTADGTIVEANEALGSMMNRSVVGETLADVLHPDDAAVLGSSMAGLLTAVPQDDERRSLGRPEVRLRPSGAGTELWAAAGVSPVRAGSEHARLFCVELFDLTERRRVAQARRETAVAEAASHAKSELVALVSHELRTPLNAVIGFAQVLQGMTVTAEQQRAGVDHILGAGRHLLRLINDLLDLTGAESGQLHLDLASVAADEIIAESLDIVRSLADERSITLLGPAPGVRRTVLADAQRVRQILLNLLGNAIKFTEPGGTVTVDLAPGRITVTDTGPGIPADDLQHLFVPFRRRSGCASEGSGLGLAVSQRLAGAMHGRLGVDSVPGQGSAFWVELPPGDPAPGADPHGRRDPAGQAPAGRVLYLEDDPASRELVRAALAPWPDVEVVTARCCAEARVRITDAPPDILLLDVELPDGNGWDLLREVSNLGQAVPLVVTAGSRSAPADMAAVEVLGKPLPMEDFLGAVSRILSSGPVSSRRPRRVPGGSA